MSRKVICLSLATVAVLAGVAYSGTYSGGTGEPNNPYRIATAQDLNDIGNHPEDFNKCFILVNDINMAGFTYTTALIAPDINNSSSGFQGTAFTGVFDGAGHKLMNLKIIAGDTWYKDYLGLFGYIDNGSEVKNLGVEDCLINGGPYGEAIGCLVGKSFFAAIFNCYSTGYVGGGFLSQNIGGLCGERRAGSISNCNSSTSVYGYSFLGGLCGYSYYGTTVNCFATGSVTTDPVYSGSDLGGLCGYSYCDITSNCYATGHVAGGDDSLYVGGLSGENDSGSTISNCCATGNVTGGEYSNNLGGLCGKKYGGSISNCYATGNVTGGDCSSNLGGLCGHAESTYDKISNCYATGTVTGGYQSSRLGGLCGYFHRGTISNCYAIGSVSGDGSLGGLVGYVGYFCDCTISNSFWDIETGGPDNDLGTGKTTAEMQTKSTFTNAGWDFVGETINGPSDIWTIHETVDYPKHVWKLVNFVGWYEVDSTDYSFFAGHWLDTNCGDSNDCSEADLDFSDKVDWADLKIFCDHWLEGTEP